MTGTEEEDRIELLRRRITEEVSQSVESSLRRRYSWIGMITAFILGGLGYGLMENVLRGASDSIVRAELVLDDVEQKLDKVDERTDQKMDELDDFVDTSSIRLQGLDERIQIVAREAEERMAQVDTLLTARQRDLENLGSTAQRIADLSTQFAGLNAVVTNIAQTLEDAEPSGSQQMVYTAYTDRLARQNSAIAEIREQTKDVVQQIKTSRISVYVHLPQDAGYSSDDADLVAEELESLGYTVPDVRTVGNVRSLKQVRFYYEEDSGAAEQLAVDISQVLDVLGQDDAVDVEDFTGWKSLKPRRGVLELWL